MNFLAIIFLTWILNAVALSLVAAIVPGIRINSVGAAAWGALAMGIMTSLVRPVLTILSFPLLLLTLGLFYFIIVAFCFLLASKMVKGFQVDGLGSGFFGAVALTLVNWLFSFFTGLQIWS